jgi:TusA-related sulfurtransferase
VSETIHEFDAGDMGCAEGLPAEFRRKLEGIPVGDVLEVIARDPSAKDDLPALSELLGHEVISAGFDENAAVVIRIRRMAPAEEQKER